MWWCLEKPMSLRQVVDSWRTTVMTWVMFRQPAPLPYPSRSVRPKPLLPMWGQKISRTRERPGARVDRSARRTRTCTLRTAFLPVLEGVAPVPVSSPRRGSHRELSRILRSRSLSGSQSCGAAAPRNKRNTFASSDWHWGSIPHACTTRLRNGRQTGRQAFSCRVIDSSSVRVEERLTENVVVVVQVFGGPLLGYGLLIELDISLFEEVVVGLITCGGEVEVLGTRLLSGNASHRDNRPLQSSVLGCYLKVARHVETVSSCAQANCRVAGRRELMSCGWPELFSKSSGFSAQAVGQTLLTYRCRSSRINQEIICVGNGFLNRYRIHPLCCKSLPHTSTVYRRQVSHRPHRTVSTFQ